MKAFGLISSVAAVFVLVGCGSSSRATSDSGDEQDLTAGDAALQACGEAVFHQALPYYENAVSAAQVRVGGQHCGDDGHGNSADRDAIADSAARAVFICPAFKDVVKNSPFAAPLRQALGDVITLKALTGDLLVLRNSSFASWEGVEGQLPGTTMWATSLTGVFFIQTRMEFKENGEGVYTRAIDKGPEQTPFTYTIQKTGSDQAPRTVTIVHEGETHTYDLGVKDVPAGDFSTAPVFQLTEPGHPEQTFTTSEDECSA